MWHLKSKKKYLVGYSVLLEYAQALLTNYGICEEDAHTVADSLVFSDLRGVDTHGIMRLPVYLKRLDRGVVSSVNRVSKVQENDTSVVIDAGNYLGPVAAVQAMECAIEKAQNKTVGIALVRNNQHYGTCAYYSMMALEHDMIGFATTNALALMAPTGGKSRMIGNNPFSFSAPAGFHRPFVLDIAMSNVAGGKIILAQKNGQKIPLGWALDKDGNPTQDAYEGFAGGGMLLPVGGHKGYGMAVMFDILCGILSGSAFGAHVLATGDFDTKQPMGTGHMMAAIRIGDLMEMGFFRQRMDQMIDEIKKAPRAQGVDELLVPGEIEFRVAEQRRQYGIPISLPVFQEVEQLGMAAGLGRLEVMGEVSA